MSSFGTGRADVGRHIGYRADHIGYGPVLLLSHRPVMFRAALGTMGEGTARGRAFTGMWRYADFRRIFRVITVVWGLVLLVERLLAEQGEAPQSAFPGTSA
jgi:hypothetical protein